MSILFSTYFFCSSTLNPEEPELTIFTPIIAWNSRLDNALGIVDVSSLKFGPVIDQRVLWGGSEKPSNIWRMGIDVSYYKNTIEHNIDQPGNK